MNCFKRSGYEPIGESTIVRLWRKFMEHWSSVVFVVILSGIFAYLLTFLLWVFVLVDTPIAHDDTNHCNIVCCTKICQTWCSNCAT